MLNTPTLLESREMYKDRYVHLTEDKIQVGEQTTFRAIYHRPPAVVVIPISSNGTFLLVKQHRWAADRFMLEFPAGKCEPGDSPEETAVKELQEEIGYFPTSLESIGGFYASPGYSTEYLHCFLAESLRPSKLDGDEDEEIEIVEVTGAEFWEMVDDGRICDSKTIAAAQLLSRHLIKRMHVS